jgi:MFS family permease
VAGSDSLGSRFWALWAAVTATNLADGLSLVAFPLLALSLTDDARLVALVSVFRFLPFLVIGLPAGVVLDRVDRRKAAVAAQVGRGLVLGITSALVFAGDASIPLIVVAAFAMGVGEVITDGGLPALVRNLVDREHLEVANSRLSATQTVTNVFIGPPIGALLFEIDPGLPFAATVALFVGAIAVLARIPGDHRADPVDPDDPDATDTDQALGFRAEILVGLRYVWGHPVLRPLALAVMAFAFVGEAGNAVYVILATERFGLSNVGYGLLISVDGVASVVTSFFVARLVRRAGHSFSMRLSIVTFVAGALLFGLTTSVVGIVVGALFAGVSDPTWNVNSATIRQRLVPDRVFGRMMTAYLFVAWSMQPFGALLGGVIAERWGAQWVSIMAACVVGSLLVFGRPLFRAIDVAMASSGPSGASGASGAGPGPGAAAAGDGAESR